MDNLSFCVQASVPENIFSVLFKYVLCPGGFLLFFMSQFHVECVRFCFVLIYVLKDTKSKKFYKCFVISVHSIFTLALSSSSLCCYSSSLLSDGFCYVTYLHRVAIVLSRITLHFILFTAIDSVHLQCKNDLYQHSH